LVLTITFFVIAVFAVGDYFRKNISPFRKIFDFFVDEHINAFFHWLLSMEIEQLKGFIVKKLFHHGCIGGKHTDIENLKKGLPGHFKGDVKKAAHELVKEEILVLKFTSYGIHVSLNILKREEIQKYLE